MNVWYVHCVVCTWKFPYNAYDLKAMNLLTKNPCKNCGKMAVVTSSIYNQSKNMSITEYPNMIVDIVNPLTTYATTDCNYTYDAFGFAQSMKDAIEKLRPLSEEFKQAELKTEFLKNKWWW